MTAMNLSITPLRDTSDGDDFRAIILQLDGATVDLSKLQALGVAWRLVKAIVQL